MSDKVGLRNGFASKPAPLFIDCCNVIVAAAAAAAWLFAVVPHATTTSFFPKDYNLGELMSTVCGCTCEGGQVWVHAQRRGLGDGPDPAGERLGHRSRSSGFSSGFSY